MSDVVNVKCQTCGSGRSLPRPPYPVTIRHSCDMAEPGRAYWGMSPEGHTTPTQVLR